MVYDILKVLFSFEVSKLFSGEETGDVYES